MKKNLMFLVALVVSASMNAQQQSLIGDDFSTTAYGGPVFKVGSFNGKTGLLSGGRGALIINHKFAIGGGGYGMITDLKLDKVSYNEKPIYMDLDYGGFEMEYINNSDKVVHWAIHTLLGRGTVKLIEHNPTVTIETDKIYFAEPGLDLDINICSWFRIGLGASYRFSMGLDIQEISSKYLNGFSGQMVFKFGSF